VGTIKNRRRKTKWDRTETEMQGARDQTVHLLERISGVENAIVRLHGVRCSCGGKEVVDVIGTRFDGDYRFGETRCFYCHRLLKAYGVTV